MFKLLIGILIVAAFATGGDYLWFEFGVRHQMAVGVLHGALLLMAVGGALGWAAGRFVAGLPIGVVAGVVGALAYYALTPTLGTTAMFLAWMAVWIILAFCEGLVLRMPRRSLGDVLVRGIAAAVLSGLTFYAVSGIVWGQPPGARNYVQQFVCWIVAWAPGMIAVGMPRRRAS